MMGMAHAATKMVTLLLMTEQHSEGRRQHNDMHRMKTHKMVTSVLIVVYGGWLFSSTSLTASLLLTLTDSLLFRITT